uniref:Interleukin n=1 Tax=Monopterus albus TaxID=43700 RepID=A0A3Q3IEM0_MONAL
FNFTAILIPAVVVCVTCFTLGLFLTKGIQLQSTCNLCRESHKPQVWLCVLENCDNEMLRCYILELMMAINEAELQAEVEAEGDCRPCEAYSLQNITIFLERLNNLLEKMSSQGTT